jgi:hypothetical protein
MSVFNHNMQELQLLSAALGLGALSGISLYLTVFVVGLCLHQGWLTLSPGLEPLMVFSNPWIWGIAAIFYFVEFFADKVPWLDSLWDAVHTVLRPVGAMFLAAAALGTLEPVVEILGVLVTGGAALAVHTAKSGFRLVVNTSPEPVSNIVTSVAEDIIVVAGVALTIVNPWLMLAAVIFFLAGLVFIGPALVRLLFANLQLTLGKLMAWRGNDDRPLPATLPHQHEILLARHAGKDFRVRWALPCWSGKIPHTPANLKGYLVALEGESDLWFTGRGFLHETATRIPARDMKVELEEKFLMLRLVFYKREKGVAASFNISLSHAPFARNAHARLGDIVVTANAPTVEILDGPQLLGIPSRNPTSDSLITLKN